MVVAVTGAFVGTLVGILAQALILVAVALGISWLWYHVSIYAAFAALMLGTMALLGLMRRFGWTMPLGALALGFAMILVEDRAGRWLTYAVAPEVRDVAPSEIANHPHALVFHLRTAAVQAVYTTVARREIETTAIHQIEPTRRVWHLCVAPLTEPGWTPTTPVPAWAVRLISQPGDDTAAFDATYDCRLGLAATRPGRAIRLRAPPGTDGLVGDAVAEALARHGLAGTPDAPAVVPVFSPGPLFAADAGRSAAAIGGAVGMWAAIAIAIAALGRRRRVLRAAHKTGKRRL